jgi:hypothetical protein
MIGLNPRGRGWTLEVGEPDSKVPVAERECTLGSPCPVLAWASQHWHTGQSQTQLGMGSRGFGDCDE